MKTVKIFLASSIVSFSRERFRLGDFVRRIEDELLLAHDLHTSLFICEDTDELMQRQGKQAAYNEHIPQSDLFVLLAKDSVVGPYTLQEWECAVRSAQSGKPRRLLVAYTGTQAPELPAAPGICVCRSRFADLAGLEALVLAQLQKLDEAYGTLTAGEPADAFGEG